MRLTDRLRFSSITYFVLSILIRWLYNLIALFVHGFTDVQRTILHLLLAVVSLVLGWFALQLYRKAQPTGSNLGCFYLVLLLLNLIGGAGALFFSVVQFFSEEGNSSETIWLL
jgi:hypothetical protein